MQQFILPITPNNATAFAQTRLWLYALGHIDTPSKSSIKDQLVEMATPSFCWQSQHSRLLDAAWLQEATRQTPSVWQIRCTEKATPPAIGCLMCIEKTNEQDLLLRQFDYRMAFDESLVQWQWLELLAQQHKCTVWGVIPAQQ